MVHNELKFQRNPHEGVLLEFLDSIKNRETPCDGGFFVIKDFKLLVSTLKTRIKHPVNESTYWNAVNNTRTVFKAIQDEQVKT